MMVIEELRRFYHHNNNVAIVKTGYYVYKFLERIYNTYTYHKAGIRLNKLSRNKIFSNKKIHIIFLMQEESAWLKLKDIYDVMHEDERFEINIVCMSNCATFEDDKAVYDYMKNITSDAVYYKKNDGSYVDLKKLKPDYVFYSAPYNGYFPKEYRSDTVSQYAKICFIPYALSANHVEDNIVLNMDFSKDVYCYYAEWETAAKENEIRMAKYLGSKYRRSVFLGYPVLSSLIRSKGKKSKSWMFSKNKFRVMWTPRWTTDIKIGGSHFLDYKDSFLKYADQKDKFDFLFRPHPMTFSHFLGTGQMSQEELDKYIKDCAVRDNTHIDTENDYSATIWQSSVLVSDYSSLILEYFLTGKPIIYCQHINRDDMLDDVLEIYDTFYYAYDFHDIKRHLQLIYEGDDPMRKKRIAVRNKIFGNEKDILKIPERIVEDIVNDYNNW